jgi:SNF2 family DNA or RNA helicase
VSTIEAEFIETKLTLDRGPNKRRLLTPVKLRTEKGRIWFHKAPFALKDEIKAMRGAKWHGHDDPPKKIWSVEDCPRNWFQLDYLAGKPVYDWFDRPLESFEVRDDLMTHQRWLVDRALTYHYRIWAAEMGVGKTLAAQSLIEVAGGGWIWVGPKSSLTNIRREFAKWKFAARLYDDAAQFRDEFYGDGLPQVLLISYEQLAKLVAENFFDGFAPRGLICDESSRLKTYTAARTRAVQVIADKIRELHSTAGYVVLMSGTPSPKTPLDWWAQAEIVWPGFLKEGSVKSLERRLAFLVDAEYESGVFKKRIGWRDDGGKCSVCGQVESDHDTEHSFEPAVNEVAYLYERLGGLVDRVFKRDCLTLPDKQYREIELTPSGSVLRLADAVGKTARSAMTAATQLRELSDGFLYQDKIGGTLQCPHCPDHCGTVVEWFDPQNPDASYESRDFLDPQICGRLQSRSVPCPRCNGTGQAPRTVRVTTEIACPKDDALRDLLDECEDAGRIVTFAGFTGSIDRIERLCTRQKWGVVRCDGRGFHCTDENGVALGLNPLDVWADREKFKRIAWVAHPESGGMSFTLVEASMAVFWSNCFKPEYRVQAEDRIHRPGMDENRGCTIVDLLHLPSDRRVLEVIRENRRIELMTLGEFLTAA